MKRLLVFFIVTEFCSLLAVQNISSFRDSILKESLQKDIAFLCDPDLSGRKFATPGEMKSADYLRDQLARYGLNGINKNPEEFFQNYIQSYDTLLSFTIEKQNGIF